jgi:TPP-dependent pyruvate/acetoin dehydrogenase alpha subunit
MSTTAGIDREHGLELLRQMLLVRRFEEKCVELYSATKIRGFLYLYIGEEAVAVGAMQALTPEDAIVETYREHGHGLVRGVSPGSIMAEMYSKVEGCAVDAEGRCTCSMPPPASMAATPSLAAGCRWRSDWRSPTSYRAAGESLPASSATAPWPRASFTNA